MKPILRNAWLFTRFVIFSPPGTPADYQAAMAQYRFERDVEKLARQYRSEEASA